MILKYGTYSHPITPIVKMRSVRIGQADGASQGTRRTWEIDGSLIATPGGTALTAQIASLVSAYASDGLDLKLCANDGTAVIDQLLSASARYGTVVRVRPEFPQGSGSELVTHRTYHIVVDAEFLVTTTWGFKRTNSVIQPNGELVADVYGEYTGDTLAHAQAAAAAAALTSPWVQIDEPQFTSDVDTRKCSFHMRFVDTTNSRQVVAFQEEVGLQPAFTRRVAHEILGGNPVIQATTTMPARGYQRGRAIGVGSYPSFPTATWSTAYYEEPADDGYGSAERVVGGLIHYPIFWNRRFVFDSVATLSGAGTWPA
jgi:hypothetical protein